ncbi:uncharacterized protein LOC113138041 isoform X2 [Mastacembelus armatus]|uniref:uncharacterized protein LOC113138041 isoform X2 n=1 Tax=Mastacembelus armatus TaxID=205130 RepID=UPI000E45F132|nr:uncharacterized protein LOC113138041 isoform X2 [Mastacembelus armatus]
MDLKNTQVMGGVLIVHQVHDGKHHYEVENVVKDKTNSGKMFVRRGDKLMQINGMDLQSITPEELAQMLAEGNPMLTVHKVDRMEECKEQSSPSEATLHPFSKESITLNFSMEMMREEDLEENEDKQEAEGREDGVSDEDVCQAEDEENGEDNGLLIVAMNKTSISVVKGRGCDSSSCQGCHGSGCTFNNIVMVTESSTVTLVPRGSTCFRQEKLLNASIEHVASHHYLRAICPQKTLYASPNPEKITIYHYKSNSMDTFFRGMPVVLNFSESNCFLRCCKEGERVLLRVEVTDQDR